MSTEITPQSLQDKLRVTSFWGGQERGVCLQLNTLELTDSNSDYTQLTQAEVIDLIVVLLEWTSENMKRKLSGNQTGATTKGQQHD